MTHTVEIESSRTMDVHGLLSALTAHGLVGEVVEAGRRFRLFVEADDDARPRSAARSRLTYARAHSAAA